MGEISGLTGVDDPYDVPPSPELVIPAHEQPVSESVRLLVAHLTEQGLAGTPRPNGRTHPKEY